jgi:cobalt-zinc-cadmium resistance protein CzcA
METGDYIITLKPKSEWSSAETREELVAKMEEALIPLAGVKFEFQQPIQMRFNELLSGSKQDIAIKIFGDDLNILAEKGAEAEKIISGIEGVEDISVEKVTGLAQVQVAYDRDRLAQYGLSVSEVNRILRTAFAGSEAGVVFDGEKRFDMVVRLAKDFRKSLDDVQQLSVALPDGGQIPFQQIARIEIRTGPAQVSRENTKRRITIGFNVRNRDIESVIKEVSNKMDQGVRLPTGYFIQYGGQFKNLEAARSRLAVAVPVALLFIFILLYFTFKSVKQTILIYSAVPMAAMGGVFALWLRGMDFSISAGVGFIALFGVAVLNGIVLIAEFNRLEKAGVTDITERVLKGLHNRLRPVLMTAAVASLGFLPMALSTSAGAEVQKPLATVVIGGLITATFLTLVILPIFYIVFSSHSFRRLLRPSRTGALPLVVLGLAVSFMPGETKAQSPLRIDAHKAVQLALEGNPAIQVSAYHVEAQKALKGSAWDIPKTSVEGQYGQSNSYTRDNSFTISQSFAFPTVYINQSRLADAQIVSSEWQLKQTQLEMATHVKQLYWQWVYLWSKYKLLMYQDSLFSGFARAAALRARSGETNRLEMISARSQSLEIKNQIQQVTADLSICHQKLQTVVHLRQPLIPADTVLFRISGTSWNDTTGLSDNPAASYAHQQIEIARLEVKVENSKMLPDFSIGYFSQTMQGIQDIGGVPRAFGSGDRFTGFQAGISLPLWFTPHVSRARAARIRQQAAQISAGYYSESLLGQYQTLLAELSKHNTTLAYYEEQAVPEAGLIIDQATRSYKAGALDYLDYILTLNRALSIRHNYLDALNDFNQTIISLEFVTGKI